MDLTSQLHAVVGLADRVLGRNLLGVYLHGSAVQGGLRPASDVDVLVLSRRSLDDAGRTALTDGLLPLSGTANQARPLELIVVVQGDLRPWRHPPRADFLYGEWLRDAIAADGPPRPEPMPGLAVMLPVALAADHVLHGPSLTDLVDPVPAADVMRGTRDGVPDLVASLAGDERNAVLTLARVWTTLATGQIRSKDEAADWAMARLPSDVRPVLAAARSLYLGSSYADESWPDGLLTKVPVLVDELVARIEQESAYSPW